jgi:enoyl reductase
MSRAIVFSRYGGPEVLELVDVEPPEPGPRELRVRVKAAGVQPVDCLIRSGRAAQWMPASFPQRLGNEFAGVVDRVGGDVHDFALGDEVLGWAVLASYAEHDLVGADQVTPKPAEMPWPEAGALSASGQTAAKALRRLGLAKRETVLIHAAAGGVGTFAVQLARAMGATAIGTASERNHDYLRALGAIPVSYGPGLTARVREAAPNGVDAALDAAGTEEALTSSLELVTDLSRVGAVAFNPAAERLGVRRLSTERSSQQLAQLTELYSAAKLQIVIQQSYPLEDAAAAHREVETGHVRGKIVLIV